MGVASVAEAMPMAPMPSYHWCPGQWWDPAWGNNWGWDRCHDDGYWDGEPRDAGHWHGYGPWNGGGPGWENRGPGWGGPPPPGGPGWDHGPGGPGWNDHRGY
jgi:hypothetical protein